MGACGARAGGHRSPPRGHTRCAALGRPAGQQHAGQQPGRVGRPRVRCFSVRWLQCLLAAWHQSKDLSLRPMTLPVDHEAQFTARHEPSTPKALPKHFQCHRNHLHPSRLLHCCPRDRGKTPTRPRAPPAAPRAPRRDASPPRPVRATHAARGGRGEGRARRKGRQELALATDGRGLQRAPPLNAARTRAVAATRARVGNDKDYRQP